MWLPFCVVRLALKEWVRLVLVPSPDSTALKPEKPAMFTVGNAASGAEMSDVSAGEKPSASLPYARFESSGTIFHGAATLEATWR